MDVLAESYEKLLRLRLLHASTSRPAQQTTSGPGSRPTASAAPIVGRWKEPKGTDVTEFHADGTVTERPASGETIRGRYLLESSKLRINLEGVPEEICFAVVIKGDQLEMTGPDGQTIRSVRIS